MSEQRTKPEVAGEVFDAVKGNWVDRFAPQASRPYLRLSRADRPIGTWLLLFPCWWGLFFAILADGQFALSDVWIFVGCGLGAFLMRASKKPPARIPQKSTHRLRQIDHRLGWQKTTPTSRETTATRFQLADPPATGVNKACWLAAQSDQPNCLSQHQKLHPLPLVLFSAQTYVRPYDF